MIMMSIMVTLLPTYSYNYTNDCYPNSNQLRLAQAQTTFLIHFNNIMEIPGGNKVKENF